MSPPAPLRVAVVGAGLMGHGIAQVFALGGHAVRLHDAVPAVLDTALARIRGNLVELGEDLGALDRITPRATLAEAVTGADYVVEAAAEHLAVKQALFAEIEAAGRPDTVLASNTSVIPITAIMEGLHDPSRALGTHWWNPPFLIPLVEVIGTARTRPDVVAWTMELHRGLGKTPVHVKRDVPGFIGNRMQAALWREAISLVENGICEAADIDLVVKASFGRRLAVLGPMENADLIGTDLTLAIHRTVLEHIEARGAPSPYLERLVEEGRLGIKTGEGFLAWAPGDADAVRRRLNRHLRAALDDAPPGRDG